MVIYGRVEEVRMAHDDSEAWAVPVLSLQSGKNSLSEINHKHFKVWDDDFPAILWGEHAQGETIIVNFELLFLVCQSSTVTQSLLISDRKRQRKQRG